jgi:hypothetical protein
MVTSCVISKEAASAEEFQQRRSSLAAEKMKGAELYFCIS